MMKHTCHAVGCETEIPPKLFMCRRHWYALPKNLRDRIWETYVPGQEIRKDPSFEYLAVANECIRYLQERRTDA